MKALMHTQRIARLLVLVWRAFVERLLRALAVVFSRCLHGFVIIPLQSAIYHTNMVSMPVVCSINTLRTVRGDWLSTLSWGITNLALSIKTILDGRKYCFLCKCHLIVNKVQLFFQVLGRSGWKTLFIGLKSFVVVRFCHNVYKVLCGSQIKAVSSASESRRDSLFIFENSQAELLMVKQKTITNNAPKVALYSYFIGLLVLLLEDGMGIAILLKAATFTTLLPFFIPLTMHLVAACPVLIQPSAGINFICPQLEQDFKKLMTDLNDNDRSPNKIYSYGNLIPNALIHTTSAKVLVNVKTELELLHAAEILGWRQKQYGV